MKDLTVKRQNNDLLDEDYRVKTEPEASGEYRKEFTKSCSIPLSTSLCSLNYYPLTLVINLMVGGANG